MKNKDKIGVVIPTCDEGRKEFVKFLLGRVERQTLKADYISIIDHPNNSGKSDITSRYHQGLRECFSEGCDLVLMMEDDDYYPLNYIEQMYKAWVDNGKPVLIGLNRYTYYHILERGYKSDQLGEHSSAYTTGVTPRADLADTDDAFLFDIVLWRNNAGELVEIKDNPVGIKHGITTTGGNGHNRRMFKHFDDDNYTVLKGLVDREAFDFYTKMQPPPMTLYEWRNLFRRLTKSNRHIERVAWALDTSYAGFPFIVNYMDAKAMVYTQKLEYFDEMVRGMQVYQHDVAAAQEILKHAKELFLFGAKGTQYLINILRHIGRRLCNYKVTLFVTDSWWYKDVKENHNRIRTEIDAVDELKVFCMPDIPSYSPDIMNYNPRLYMQSIPHSHFADIPKLTVFTVAHSPGLKAAQNEKGTRQIKEVWADVNIISGVTWQESIKEKIHAAAFVDQLITPAVGASTLKLKSYKGGLGKSGLEAMLAGCVVITSGKFAYDDEFEKCPVLLAGSKKKLKSLLLELKEMFYNDRDAFDGIAAEQRRWALKHTDLNYNLKRIDPQIKRTTQINTSFTVRFFEKNMKQKFKLTDVTNAKEPVLLKGMYREEDYLYAERYEGEKSILWCGTDVTYLDRLYRKYLPIQGRHLAISENVQERLKAIGVDAIHTPITSIAINYNPQPRGECVYFYGRGENYGESLMKEIRQRIPYEVIVTTGKHSSEEIEQMYKRSFIGLRLTPRDGFANTVLELGLMGRRCLWNCGYAPNAIKYNPADVDGIVELIHEEYKRRRDDPTEVALEMKRFLEGIGDYFLYVHEKKKMELKITAIAFVYNELPYIDFAVRYYKSQGLDIYIIDNYSDDGTWEWLQDNGIPSHRFDTQGAFNLEELQGELIKTVESINPDWFVWFSPDLFQVFERLVIRDAIDTAEKMNFNQIKSKCYQFKHTGERYKRGMPLAGQFYYAQEYDNALLISKWDKGMVRMSADKIYRSDANVICGGVILEYGGCKTKAQQEGKLKRREKAWAEGMNNGHGVHYRKGKERGWRYEKAELINMKLTHKELIEKIINYEKV